MAKLEPYSNDVARIYDILTYDRADVEADEEEVAFLQWAFEEACPRDVGDILDVGCGTGRHTVPLARLGWQVTALDNSPGMLDECRRKLERHDLAARLVEQDLEALEYEGEFDAALCMDSAICYLLESERIVRALEGLRRALRPGALLVLDNWNFFAQWDRFGYPYEDVRGTDRLRIEYKDWHWLDNFASRYHIEITAKVHEEGRDDHVIEKHEILKAMTADEMRMYLEKAGFEHVAVYPGFARPDEPPPHCERLVFLAVRP